MTTVRQDHTILVNEARRLQAKAEHYATAFRAAARITENRAGDTATGQMLKGLFINKAELEENLARRLRKDPIRTMMEEGLV